VQTKIYVINDKKNELKSIKYEFVGIAFLESTVRFPVFGLRSPSRHIAQGNCLLFRNGQ